MDEEKRLKPRTVYIDDMRWWELGQEHPRGRSAAIRDAIDHWLALVWVGTIQPGEEDDNG